MRMQNEEQKNNPKFEYRNPKQIQRLKIQIAEMLSQSGGLVLNCFEVRSFVLVSDFDIRISDLRPDVY
jgi:hypothetical protein